LVYDNIKYSNDEVIKIENTIEEVVSDKRDISKKINDKVYNIDTNTYENIIYNKKEIAINLLNNLDTSIMKISKDIIRNYLVKNIVYKLTNRIVEVQINQNDLLVSFHRDAKQFDIDNKLNVRKGYEKNSICYSMSIEDIDNCVYAVKIIEKLYEYMITPKENLSDKLFDTLKAKIFNISSSVTTHITNKGLMFKDKRNFVLLSKTTYGLYVRLLNVENKDNILNVVTRKNYEPLCLSFKVKNEEDIDILFPFINSSYVINKINPYDLKKEFYKYYVTE